MTTNNTCCPEFNQEPWNGKTHIWKDKLFLKDEVRSLFHIPLNIGSVITRMWKQVETAQANPKNEEFLILFYDPSPWKSEVYMTVTKDIPKENITKLTGTFFSKVFDGPYNAAPKWIQEMDKVLKDKGFKAIKYYFHYAYCPKCAKKYGHNYCIAFAQVK